MIVEESRNMITDEELRIIFRGLFKKKKKIFQA